MPRGGKSAYTDKQKRKAEHIAERYREWGVSAKEAKSRAWAAVINESGGGKSGSQRGRLDTEVSLRHGGDNEKAIRHYSRILARPGPRFSPENGTFGRWIRSLGMPG